MVDACPGVAFPLTTIGHAACDPDAAVPDADTATGTRAATALRSIAMDRDLSGRCGTCGWYIRKRQEPDESWVGDCRLGQGRWPLKDMATCSSHKPKDVPWDQALKRKPAAGAPRSYRDEAAPKPRPTIPSEIGIDMDQETFRQVLREVLLDELGVRDVEMGDRWNDGELVLVPGKEGTQDKRIPRTEGQRQQEPER